MGKLTHEQIVLAVIGLLAVIGGVLIVLSQLFKRLNIFSQETPAEIVPCPHIDSVKPVCVTAQSGISDRLITLENGMNVVKETLENKRVRIENLATDVTTIKTDVKWIVRELSGKNSK